MLAVWVAGRAGALGLPGFLLFPLGLGLTFSGATVAALAGVGGEEQGLAGGVVNTAMEVGPTVGLAALVSLSRLRASVLVQGGHAGSDATAAGYAAALYVAAFLFALLFVGFLVVLRRLETRPVTSS